MRKYALASIAFLLTLCCGGVIAQECSQLHGNPWTDEFHFTWFLDSSGNGVVETNCGEWSSYGSAPGSNGFFEVYAVNDLDGNPDCNHWFHYYGRNQLGGCKGGDGQWDNDYQYTGNWYWSKACEVPSDETTGTGGHWDGPHYIFDATMNNTVGGNLSGRAIRETNYAPAVDGCWYSGSPIPPVTGVTGAGDVLGPLTSSNSYQDVVGWSNAAIIHYRTNGNAPCSFDMFQRAEISCGIEIYPEPFQNVKSNVLNALIDTTTIRVSRGSVVKGPITY
jgi:hypothetical protein